MPICMPQNYLKMEVLTMTRINHRSKVSQILCKLIRFLKDNGYILDRFYYKDFNSVLSITLDLYGIISANPAYNEDKVPKTLYKLIRFVKTNRHILNKFCCQDFNLILFMTLGFYGIAYADPIYNERFCFLIIFLPDDCSESDLYYLVSK